ncbi:hypothetical protein CIHG_10113 [Coccidioides immitis H538.4]|uniref:Uncharacterized protein n=3 Tax=Coccidioides immitis TaxID=5501 RepID=A0A0J8RAJ6_COCIT|nr:hypothetical protein CIRG_00175 [Coccidioides immitis RMSCC 2394]KMU81871.1 hypothetical protein CISG_02887 [Coccidioides immitis RMSCC 3703]KMU92269.1 hypothetical protein CIHG_10113 [Coccidioides immitis H538.4]
MQIKGITVEGIHCVRPITGPARLTHGGDQVSQSPLQTFVACGQREKSFTEQVASQGFGIFIPKSPFPTWSACTQPTTEYSATKGLCAVVTPEAEPCMRTRGWIEMDPSRRVNQGYQHKRESKTRGA